MMIQYSVYNALCFLNSEVRSKLPSFVTRGYAEWHNIREKQKMHVGHSYYTDAMVKALEINDKFEKSANTIEYQTNKEIQDIKYTHH